MPTNKSTVPRFIFGFDLSVWDCPSPHFWGVDNRALTIPERLRYRQAISNVPRGIKGALFRVPNESVAR
jgi:hypothetical protein